MKIGLKSGLVKQSLEMISRDIFTKHSDLITSLIGKSSGVYALYDENELYYVGRATQLRKRVRQHLKDRHLASWTYFSIYLVKRVDHIGDMESLLIRIANPKGNNVKPKGRDSRNLSKQLIQLIKQKQAKELSTLLPQSAKRRKQKDKNDVNNLKNIVSRKTSIYRTHKGVEHKAVLTPGGLIIYKDKKYSSPTAAAKVIVKWGTVNGWRFWNIKDKSGNWVKLRDYQV